MGNAELSEWLKGNSPEVWDARANRDVSDHVAADWGSAASQEKRFAAILNLPLVAGDTLIDFGCGTGRLADFIPPGVAYEGIDWSSAIIDEATRRRPSCSFRVGSVEELHPADWVIACGPFNIADGWSRSQTRNAVRSMWQKSRKGIAVSLMRSPSPERLHYRADEVVEYLEDCDWSALELDRSYLPNDLCMRAWR